jgi:hypothetical protein
LDILRKWMQEFMDVGTKKKNDSSGSLVQLVKQERRGGAKNRQLLLLTKKRENILMGGGATWLQKVTWKKPNLERANTAREKINIASA